MILAVVMLALIGLWIYAWFLYSLILAIVTRQAPPAVDVANTPFTPHSVSVVFSAYNEEAHIADRIRNLLAETPPGCAYEILVGIDASDDDTAGAARRAAVGHSLVLIHAFTQRRGKVAVIKDLVGRCQSELIILTDANTFFQIGSLATLLAPFRDPHVGGVCGRLALVSSPSAAAETDARTEEGFYWRWETWLKTRESRLDSCLGANGAIFAMRRALFWADIPDNTMVDDFVIGMKVREQGFQVLYAPDAVAVEELPQLAHEWIRRVRIGAGDYQALSFCRRCLLPRYGWFAWAFWSHKVLRWFTPHAGVLLAACAVASLFSSQRAVMWLGAASLAGLGFFVAMALSGIALRSSKARLPGLFLHYVTMQAALFAGFMRFATGNLTGHWKRTPR